MVQTMKETARPASKDTLDRYRELLQTEVHNLLERVGTVTTTQDRLLTNVNDIALSLEEVIGTMERLETSREFFREEIEELRNAATRNEDYSKTLFAKLKGIQKRLTDLESSE